MNQEFCLIEKRFWLEQLTLIDNLKQNISVLENRNEEIKKKMELIEDEKNRLKAALYPSITQKRPFFELKSRSAKKHRCNSIHGSFSALNNILNTTEQLQIKKVELIRTTEPNFEFELKIDEKLKKSISELNTNENCVFAKDVNFIGDRKYCGITKALHLTADKLVKTSYATIQHRKRLNAEIAIEQIENTRAFVYKDLKKKMHDRVDFYLNQSFNQEKDEEICVKLSFDETQIKRKNKLINFTFCIINEGKHAQTASGNYTLGKFNFIFY
jgi:hypothetical protein